MYYKESKKILKEIKKAKKIFIACHKGPDGDAIGSSASLFEVIKMLGKRADLYCEDAIPENYTFIPNANRFSQIDYETFDFLKYDLALIVDTSGLYMLSHLPEVVEIPIKTIVLDHHKTNDNFGELNLVDLRVSSTCEIIYKLFEDWNLKISKDLATSLLSGIISDTDYFKQSSTSIDTFKTGYELLKVGADKEKIFLNFYKNIDLNSLKVQGLILINMKVDTKHGFVWSALDSEHFSRYFDKLNEMRLSKNLFGSCVEGTDFGIVMVEESDGLSVTLKSRIDFDTLPISKELGGGGHPFASGAKIKNLPYKKAVAKVLKVARKHAKKYAEKNL